jgi:3-oxoacyl-(acyl-carrier-protein) synthase
MGKIMKSSLLSSLKAMEQAGIEKPDAIITATALGCLENSEKLLNQLQEEGEVMLKPTYFMQSTHNTIGSGIAIFTKCHGYNVTYTHGKDSLEWALRDARMLLKSGKAKSVLVGLHDETTPLYRSLMQRVGIDNLLPIHSIAIILTCGRLYPSL